MNDQSIKRKILLRSLFLNFLQCKQNVIIQVRLAPLNYENSQKRRNLFVFFINNFPVSFLCCLDFSFPCCSASISSSFFLFTLKKIRLNWK